MKKPLLIVAALVVVAILSGCTPGLNTQDGQAVTTTDISTPAKAKEVPCDQVVAVSNAVAQLDVPAHGKRNQLKGLGLDPDDKENVKAVRAALNERAEECQTSPSPSVAPSASASASPSTTPTTAPSATSTPTPSSTTASASPSASATTLPPVSYISWDQVVARPPAGLEDAINSHKDEIGFDWADADGWAKAKAKDGDLVDARVILVFGQPRLSNATARKQAGIKARNKGKQVPVVHVTACTDVVGTVCTTDAAIKVVLAPLNVQGNTATSLRAGVGVVPDQNALALYER